MLKDSYTRKMPRARWHCPSTSGVLRCAPDLGSLRAPLLVRATGAESIERARFVFVFLSLLASRAAADLTVTSSAAGTRSYVSPRANYAAGPILFAVETAAASASAVVHVSERDITHYCDFDAAVAAGVAGKVVLVPLPVQHGLCASRSCCCPPHHRRPSLTSAPLPNRAQA